MALPSNFQQLNTDYARSLGLLSNNEQAGGGLVDSRLSSANPAIVAQYNAWRQQYEPGYAYAKPGGSTQSITSVNANNVNNPTLPSGATLTPTLQQVQQNELMPDQAVLGNVTAQNAGVVSAPTVTQTQGTAQQVDPNSATGGLNPNVGQYTATTTNAVNPAVAAQGTIKAEDTVKGQYENLMNFAAGEVPDWAKGAVATAEDKLAARGLGASSIAAGAITAAIAQAALPIASQDAATYFQMDMKNLDNQQQAMLENVRMKQQNMLTDTAIQNAASQFNASSEAQVQEFTASMVAQIAAQNADRVTAMSQFNASEANKISSENATNSLSAQSFNVQQQNAINQFNAGIQNQRDIFNSQMQFAIDQSNVLWRRAINTQNNAAVNAANQTNVQNSYNLSATAMNNLWQQMRDEASWAFTASENAANRAFNLTMAANNRQFNADATSSNQIFAAAAGLANFF